jgi:hypothetical protein
MKTIRLFSAAVLSPLCVPLLFFLAGTLYSGYTNGCCGHTEKIISDTASVGLLSYIFSFLLGSPIVLVIRWRSRHETMKSYVAISAIFGAVFGYFFLAVSVGPSKLSSYYDLGAVIFGFAGAGCGAIVATAFCLIAGIRWSRGGETMSKSGLSAM